jgi:sensor c-di-GMP phosphodiesterase-like protein
VVFLRTRGCQAAQGFFYSQAVPAEAFGELLEHGLAPRAVPKQDEAHRVGQ